MIARENNFKIIAPSEARRRGWKHKSRGSKLKFFKRNKDFKKDKFFKNSRQLGDKKPNMAGASSYWPKNPAYNGKNKKESFRSTYNFKRFKKKDEFFKRKRSLPYKELFLKKFAKITYYFFKEDVGKDKKLVMLNYWRVFEEVTEPTFSFTFPHLEGDFYLGVVRSYTKCIRYFIGAGLKNVLREAQKKGDGKQILEALYKAHKVRELVDYLAKIYEMPLKAPDYYFPGYRLYLRLTFFRHLVIFTMKILILSSAIFSEKVLTADSRNVFFQLWKKIYKGWLNTYYEKSTRRRPDVFRTDWEVTRARKELNFAVKRRNYLFWRKLFRFRLERAGYKGVLLDYYFRYVWTNFNISWPYGYRKRKNRFKHDIFGRRIYLVRKPLFRRKSRKYIRWFRTLVTGGYYFSPTYAQKTFYRGGYGRRAWMSRRRARHVFKMKFVFIRYFSKRFGLKNRTEFLRKAEHVARKRGNKWLRYYKEFESRLLRVLVLFGLSSNDEMAKSLISNNWVLVNRRVLNDHDHKFIPRVKVGDLVSLTNSAAPFFLKKKFKFFKKRLSFFDRGEEAKLVYSLFKKYFLEWMSPSAYSISGTIIRHGLSALMSGPVVMNSRAYFNINRFIPFFNRALFKIFVQRFSKKLN